jgi:hypothetical protein
MGLGAVMRMSLQQAFHYVDDEEQTIELQIRAWQVLRDTALSWKLHKEYEEIVDLLLLHGVIR